MLVFLSRGFFIYAFFCVATFYILQLATAAQDYHNLIMHLCMHLNVLSTMVRTMATTT